MAATATRSHRQNRQGVFMPLDARSIHPRTGEPRNSQLTTARNGGVPAENARNVDRIGRRTNRTRLMLSRRGARGLPEGSLVAPTPETEKAVPTSSGNGLRPAKTLVGTTGFEPATPRPPGHRGWGFSSSDGMGSTWGRVAELALCTSVHGVWSQSGPKPEPKAP
jgi:hypothetical protein